MSQSDKEKASEAFLGDEYPYWVYQSPDTMRSGNAYVSASSFQWVRKDEHDRLIDGYDDIRGYLGQHETRIKVMHGYIQFLEGLCRDKGIPLPKTYTLSLGKGSSDTQTEVR